MKIKVKEIVKGCSPIIFNCGDYFDLCTAEDVTLTAPLANQLHKWKYKTKPAPDIKLSDVEFDYALIRLGVAMEIPKGYEAILVPRSSTFKKWGLLQTNSIGIIDNSYKGDKDEWKLAVVATRNVTIPKGTRLCQFRIQLSQKATVWQKIKWFFASGIKLIEVDNLDDNSRGGFGSTGV